MADAVTKKQQFLELVQTTGGVTREEAKTTLGVSDQSVYSMVYSLKQDKVNLYMGRDGKYHIRAEKAKEPQSKDPRTKTAAIADIMEMISTIPPHHKEEICQLLYNAMFAQKILEKNLEAHTDTLRAMEQVGIHFHA